MAGAQDVGFTDAFKFDQIQDVLTGIADMVRSAVDKTAPNTVEVEFGLGASVEGGKLIGLITNASGNGSFTVRLSWERSQRSRSEGTPESGSGEASKE
jgi:hypothetical protein